MPRWCALLACSLKELISRVRSLESDEPNKKQLQNLGWILGEGMDLPRMEHREQALGGQEGQGRALVPALSSN